LDGFRIDAALSTFPDKMKENWGLHVDDNLSRLFIDEARRTKPDCFIMFEGFERLEELLELADYEDCAVYNWKPRNLGTDALEDPAKLPALIAYLKENERAYQIRDELVSLGPEHDASDFEDPWAKLDYVERVLLYCLYAFMPGYMLVFNGQVFGRRHAYKKRIEETLPVPRVGDAENTEKETCSRLFRLRKEYPQLVDGEYAILDDDKRSAICLARFDQSHVVVGVINVDSHAKELVLPLGYIIGSQLRPSNVKNAYYAQDVLILMSDAKGWTSETRCEVSAETLLREGLCVGIRPKSFQIIRLMLEI
jgi:glycosidase